MTAKIDFRTCSVFLVALLLAGGCASREPERNLADGPDRAAYAAPSGEPATPIPLYKEMTGELRRDISSRNAQARAYFNQGLQLRYAFAVDAAARSFRAAADADPNCAICFWGEAWALGSYLNGAKTSGNASRAWEAARQAKELEKHASPVERALIDAIQGWHSLDYDPESRRVEDQRFADAMERVHQRFPDDLDVLAVYAGALFLLEPRRGTRELDDPDVMRLHAVLERGLAQDLRHPGVCHLYIHATESTVRPDLALPCAEHLGNSVPGASHLNHMPSHTWNEVGRWGDSVRANIQAWHSDQKAEAGRGVAIYQWHNLHMLLFAASYDGQGAIATQAGKDYRKLTDNAMYEVLTLLRFGRFDEIPLASQRPADEVGAALWDFAQGYAALRLGDRERAGSLRDAVLKFAETTELKFRFHPAKYVVGTAAHILDGEILRAGGNLDDAIDAFRRAVSHEDSLAYDEPEPLPFSARHWLGSALYEANEFEKAAQVYRAELADHPRNGWSLFGLQRSLAAQGIEDESVNQALAESWARADTWLSDSRF